MSTVLPCASSEALKNFEVEIDGERLFEAQLSSRRERILCSIVCCGTRLTGLILLVVAAVMIWRGGVLDAILVGGFGLTLIIGGIMGLEQFQNVPKRLILSGNQLTYVDNWTGLKRQFSRETCLEARCGTDDAGCGIYIIHPDQQVELLVDGIPGDIAQQITQVLNRHLAPVPA